MRNNSARSEWCNNPDIGAGGGGTGSGGTGSTGPQGPVGPAGAQGVQGAVGAQGNQGRQGAVNTKLPLISPGQAGVSTGAPLKDLPQSKVDSGRRRQDLEVNAEMTASSTRQVETALEWRLVAMVLDRICLCLFCVVTLVTSVVLLSNR